VVVQGQVYLTTAVPQEKDGDHSLRLLCLNAESGAVIWDKEVFKQDGKTAAKVHGKNSHASPTPIVHGNRIYVHFGHQGTACLDLSGRILWQNRDIKYAPVHGNGGSPVLVDDLLIFSCDGGKDPFVIALNAETGKIRWETARTYDYEKRFSFCTPLVIEVNGAKQVVLPGSGGVVAYEPKTGKEIWKVRYSGYSVVPRPVYGDGMVFLSTGYDQAVMLAIRVDGQGDVTDKNIVWQMDKNAPHNPSPLLVGDELYMVSDRGLATCLDAKTGKVHWGDKRLGGAYSASPIHDNGKIYFLSEQGLTTVIKAGKEFEEIARNDLKDRALASPAAVDGALYIRTEKSLFRIQGK
jgi:outer membrane protein assembly factor BamB